MKNNDKNKDGFSTTQCSVGESAWMEPATWRNRTLRFSYEEIDMPDAGEHMGLYGIGAFEQFKPWL